MGVPAEAGDEPSADRCTDAAGAGVVQLYTSADTDRIDVDGW